MGTDDVSGSDDRVEGKGQVNTENEAVCMDHVDNEDQCDCSYEGDYDGNVSRLVALPDAVVNDG